MRPRYSLDAPVHLALYLWHRLSSETPHEEPCPPWDRRCRWVPASHLPCIASYSGRSYRSSRHQHRMPISKGRGGWAVSASSPYWPFWEVRRTRGGKQRRSINLWSNLFGFWGKRDFSSVLGPWKLFIHNSFKYDFRTFGPGNNSEKYPPNIWWSPSYEVLTDSNNGDLSARSTAPTLWL